MFSEREQRGARESCLLVEVDQRALASSRLRTLGWGRVEEGEVKAAIAVGSWQSWILLPPARRKEIQD